MSATPGPLPTGAGWVYEMSWTGPRLLIEIVDAGVRVSDAAGRDVTATYPELSATGAGIDDALLDGHLITPGPGAEVTFLASDLLRLYGVDLRARPWAERRTTLQRLADGRPGLTVSPVFDDAEATDTAARQHGLAGVVAKRLSSTYLPGGRSPDWIECRFHRSDGFTGRTGE